MYEKQAISETVQIGDMVFLVDGHRAIGAVRGVWKQNIIVYVEDTGEFQIPLTAVAEIHSQKVMLHVHLLNQQFLTAIRHAHDHEHGA